MTLIIATEGKDFVVIGSDTRGLESYLNVRMETNMEEKIIKVSDHVCITVAGNGEIGIEFIERFKKTLSKNLDGVSSIAEKFRKFCKKEYFEKIKIRTENFSSPEFIITGLDKEGSKYKKSVIYRMDDSCTFYPCRRRNYCFNGKGVIANYLFSKLYKRRMGQNKLPDLVAQSIYDTGRCDGDVNTNVKIFIIDSSGFRKISDSDVKYMFKTWEQEHLDTIT